MTGTRCPRRPRETETSCHRETETGTSSVAAAPTLPTANGSILRLDTCLRRTSGRTGAILAAGYADEKSYGRFGPRSSRGYQNEIFIACCYEQCEKDKERVLVHCMSGKSRSPTVVIAYMMKFKGMRLAQSYQWVKERRPSVELTQGGHCSWKPEVEFDLNEDYPVFLKHPVLISVLLDLPGLPFFLNIYTFTSMKSVIERYNKVKEDHHQLINPALEVKLSGDINEEVDSHNHMLDRMGNDMDGSRGVLSGTMDKF